MAALRLPDANGSVSRSYGPAMLVLRPVNAVDDDDNAKKAATEQQQTATAAMANNRTGQARENDRTANGVCWVTDPKRRRAQSLQKTHDIGDTHIHTNAHTHTINDRIESLGWPSRRAEGKRPLSAVRRHSGCRVLRPSWASGGGELSAPCWCCCRCWCCSCGCGCQPVV